MQQCLSTEASNANNVEYRFSVTAFFFIFSQNQITKITETKILFIITPVCIHESVVDDNQLFSKEIAIETN